MLRPVACFCVWLVLWSLAAPCAMAQSANTQKPTLKEQVLLMDIGSVVDVSLKNKEKIRGRLGAVSDTGFDVQYVVKDQSTTRTLNFDEVRKVKLQEKGMGLATKITLGVLAGLGVLLLISLVAVAASGGFDS